MSRPTKYDRHADDARLKALVRRDYETTDLSLRALANQHGIKSDNTIRRWRDEEGWQRDFATVTAGLVTRAVTMSPRELSALHAAQDGFSRPPIQHVDHIGHEPGMPGRPDLPIDVHLEPPKVSPGEAARKRMERKTRHLTSSVPETAPPEGIVRGVRTKVRGGKPSEISYEPIPGDPEGVAAHKFPPEIEKKAREGVRDFAEGRVSHSPVAARRVAREVEDRVSVKSAQRLADIHADAMRRQNDLAEKIMATGSEMLDQIRTVISDEDVDVRGAALQALTSVNLERETLAGLLKAASNMIREGAMMQRRVWGMDLVTPPAPNTPPPAAEKSPEDKLLASMPTEMLQLMRDMLRERAMERPEAAGPSEAALERARTRGPLLPPAPQPGDTPTGGAA